MDTNWTMFVVLALITGIAVWTGKAWFRRWFNPLSIYSAIWGFCLCNYELRLIQYEPISSLAWFYIFLAWASLFLGAGCAFLLLGLRSRGKQAIVAINMDRLRVAIVVLTCIGAVELISQLLAIKGQFGNPFSALVTDAGEIYAARTENELSAVSYVGAFSLAACAMAGIYTARRGRLTLVGTAPLITISLQLIAVMGRTGLGMGAVLFLATLLYTPPGQKFTILKWQRVLGTAIGMLLVGSFTLVSSVRRLNVSFPGITPAMEDISTYVPFFPSIYSNFSATPVAFSLYLSSPSDLKEGHWGTYTFAPVLRLLSHMGFETKVPAHEENYYTPVPINTSTYLKNLYSDFGPSGVVLFPLGLGFLIAMFTIQISRVANPVSLVLLANLYMLAVFAFSFDFMLLGAWYISTVCSVAAGMWCRSGSVRSIAAVASTP